jgi:predicted transcriptional regulator
MTLREIAKLLEAEVLTGEDMLDGDVKTAFGADLMSDVLALAKPGSLLLTGLTNPQVMRTCHVLGIAAVVVVRGKKPTSVTIDLARELEIPLLTTRYILFESAGRLYAGGIVGCVAKVAGDGSG